MAIVFLARDLRHGRDVALKVLRPEVGAALGAERFLREIQIVAGLTHPHILPLHDSGEADGLVYFVMPYVRGETLRQRLLRTGPLAVDEAVRIARDIAGGLAYAHEHGIIHRDIKPENILLEGHEAMVADFGIARAVNESVRDGISQPGLAIGTPHYMSPEQASGLEHVDGRADIYSLGCVLFEMLSGAPPFSGPTPQSILAKHRSEPPPEAQALRPTVTPGLAEALATALRKLPADRHRSAAEFAIALDHARTGPSTPVAGTPTPGRRWLWPAVATLLAAALVVVLVWRPWRPERLDPNRVFLAPMQVAGTVPARAAVVNELLLSALRTALAYAPTVRTVDPWAWLPEAKRDDPLSISDADLRAAARRAGAGRIARGSVMLADSARLVLTLEETRGDSILARATAAASTSGLGPEAFARSAWQLGQAAGLTLLPKLIPAGGRDAALALRALNPSLPAAATFLLGEIEYRAARYDSALVLFEGAVAEDSGFAMAAIRGAQAASWLDQPDRAVPLAELALARDSALPPRLRLFAQGLVAYLRGDADRAAAAYRMGLTREPDWAEGWAVLGEVYEHLLPRAPQPDSVARDAFDRAWRLDAGLTPPLYHLAEAALRRAELARADTLIARYAVRATDSVGVVTLRAMRACLLGDTPPAWRAFARNWPQAAFNAASQFATGGLWQPGCARAGWEAVLATPVSEEDLDFRGFAQLGLIGLDVAADRAPDAADRFRRDTTLGAGLRALLPLVLLDAGVPVREEAEQSRAAILAQYGPSGGRAASPAYAWALGVLALATGDARGAREAIGALAAHDSVGPGRLARQLRASLEARLLLAGGDSAAALAHFEALRPTGTRGDVAWRPWESLGAERLLLARLRLARGDSTGALQVASTFDATAAYIDLLYLRPSLELRAQAAGARGGPYRRRLDALSSR